MGWRRPTGIAAVDAAKVFCDSGHEFTEANTYRHVDGRGYVRRMCRGCNRICSRRKYVKRTVGGDYGAAA